jgi:cell shape-determining protein MreD
VAILVYEMVVFFLGLFFGQTFLARIGVFFLTAVLSTLIVPILYPILCAIGKIGGEPWKE